MDKKNVISHAIDIIVLAQEPNPLSCIKLANNMITAEDPISELVYNMAKSELSVAEGIMANFVYEGDKNGAIHRILTHLETAARMAIDYYKKKNNAENPINFMNPWFLTEKGKTVHGDIVRIQYYQCVLHTLLGSDSECIVRLLQQIPLYTDYQFGMYTDAVSRLFDTEEWENILIYRKYYFIENMCCAADMIDRMPYLFPGSTLINDGCLKRLQRFLETRVDAGLAKVIVEQRLNMNVRNYI